VPEGFTFEDCVIQNTLNIPILEESLYFKDIEYLGVGGGSDLLNCDSSEIKTLVEELKTQHNIPVKDVQKQCGQKSGMTSYRLQMSGPYTCLHENQHSGNNGMYIYLNSTGYQLRCYSQTCEGPI
jgi:hypothetical protein